MNLDIGLQVLDNVIMTKWKVLPKEQQQGQLQNVVNSLPPLIRAFRHTKFCSQFHHPEFGLGREPESATNIRQQTEPRPRLNP